MSATEELQAVLEKVLTEKTFSLEVIDEIKKLRDKVKVLETRNEYLEKTNETNGQIIGDKDKTIDILEQTINAFKDRMGEIEKREKEMTKLELNAASEINRRQDIFNLVNLLFKNTEAKKVMTKTTRTDGTVNGQYVNTNATDTNTEVTTKE